MLSAPHQIVVMALRERPELLGDLLARLHGLELAPALRVVDSTVRIAIPDEVRPDLLLEDADGRWTGVEVQSQVDDEKRRRWPLLASALHDQRGVMGDLVVLTPSRAVARWARTVAVARGALGTRLGLEPLVLHLSPERTDLLLDEAQPSLALLAAWAVGHRHGAEARRVVTRALQLGARLPAPLRQAHVHAILNVLSERMTTLLREVAMDPAKIPEGPAMRKFRLESLAEGEARGEAIGKAIGESKGRLDAKREALLAVLAARRLAVSSADAARIAKCDDAALLDRWIGRAARATSIAEALR